MIVEYEDYKTKIGGLKPKLGTIRQAMKLDEVSAEIDRLQAESEAEGFWSDQKNSQKVLQRLKQLKNRRESFEKLESRYDDLATLCEMAIEEDDISLLPELEGEYDAFVNDLETTHLSTMLSGEYDSSNVPIHSGGTR